jgi:hypothetical protein
LREGGWRSAPLVFAGAWSGPKWRYRRDGLSQELVVWHLWYGGQDFAAYIRQPSGFVCSTLRPDDYSIGFPSRTARRPRRAAASGTHLPICRAAQAGTLLDGGLTPGCYRGGIPFPSPAIRRDGRFWPTNLGQYRVIDPGSKASMCPLNAAPGPNRKTARHQYVRA